MSIRSADCSCRAVALGRFGLTTSCRFAKAKSASRIDRVDRQRQNSLRGGVAPGEALSDCTQKLRDAVQKLDMPPQFSCAVYGKARELERTFDELVVAFLLSLAFVI